MTDLKVDALKQEIEGAFADVPYPGDEAIGYDPDDWEAKDINRDFKGHHWRDATHQALFYHRGVQSLFSPAGRQYYLPAFLFAALDGDVDIGDPTIYEFIPSEKPDLRDFFMEHFGHYTPAQKQAVKHFLEYMRDEHPLADQDAAQEALEKYWGRDWLDPQTAPAPEKG